MGKQLEFCRLFNAHPHLHCYIVFCLEALFTRDGLKISETPGSGIVKIHEKKLSIFRHCFSVNMWYGVVNRRRAGPRVLRERLTGDKLLFFGWGKLTVSPLRGGSTVNTFTDVLLVP
jgi:hypothetical protein